MRIKPLIGLLVVVLVLHGYLGLEYMSELKEQEALHPRIADARQSLSQLPETPANLEERLAVAEALLMVERDAFPARVNTTQIIGMVLDLAGDSGVKAVPLGTQPWAAEEHSAHSFSVFRMKVAVEGSFSGLLTFIGRLQNTEFETLVVEGLNSVTRQSAEGDSTDGSVLVTAELSLAVYILASGAN